MGVYFDPVYYDLRATKGIKKTQLESLEYIWLCDSYGYVSIEDDLYKWSDDCMFGDLNKLIAWGVRGEFAVEIEGEHCLYVLTDKGIKCYGGEIVYDREYDLFDGKGRPLTIEEWEARNEKESKEI